MKRVRFDVPSSNSSSSKAKDAESSTKSRKSRRPVADMVPLYEEDEVDEREIVVPPPIPQGMVVVPPPTTALAAPLINQHRVAYTVKDNRHYYELGATIVLIYGHVRQGIPVSSLFLPNESVNAEYDF